MKRNAIVRLCIWTVVSLSLIGLFIGWMTGSADIQLPILSLGVTNYQYKNADRYTSGNTEIAEQVRSIDVIWISGSVTVVPWEGDTVRIREGEDITDPELQLHWYLENDRLHIQYCASKRFQTNLPSKDLMIELPGNVATSLSSIEIESVSASVELRGLCVRDLKMESVSGGFTLAEVMVTDAELDTVSGRINATGLNSTRIDVETTSGSVRLDGRIGSGSVETGSGDATLTSSTTFEALDLETVSGSFTLVCPLGEGYRVAFHSVSGRMESEIHHTKSGNNYSFGSGKHAYTFESVSGDLLIKEP